MKLLLFSALVVALAVTTTLAEEEKEIRNGRPQPRQIFRGGLSEDAPKLRRRRPHLKRPSLQKMRERQREIGVGRLPLGPTPKYNNPDFSPEPKNEDIQGVEIDGIGEAGPLFPTQTPAATSPADVEEENQIEEEQHPVTEVTPTEETQDYVVEEFSEEEHYEPETNYVEAEDYEETRSPAHRYPDEEYSTPEYRRSTPSDRDVMVSASSQEKEHFTIAPFRENEFSPFSLFDDSNDPPQRSNTEERYQESPSRNRFRGNRFANTPAQERNFETRSPVYQRGPEESQRKSFEARPSIRLNQRQQYNQPLNQNYINQNSYTEEPKRSQKHSQGSEDYPEDYEDEPDRLSELLLISKFGCVGRKDGYYADEDVDCEVFHFCQDNVKHSWLCPNDAAFHQVHLICMPRSEDNICAKSSKFHFVNDFLYKEVGDHPKNRTYVERYYPQGYESGVANIRYQEGEVPPQAVNKNPYRGRPHNDRPRPPPGYNSRQQGGHKPRNEVRAQAPHRQQIHNARPREEKPKFQARPSRPVFQERENEFSHFQEEEDSRPKFVERRPPPPQFNQPEEKFQRPVFKNPTPLREQSQRPAQTSHFQLLEREEPEFDRPAFHQGRRQESESRPDEGHQSHFSLGRPRPTKIPEFREQENRIFDHRPRQPRPTQLEVNEPPLYRPQQSPNRPPYFQDQNRGLQALHSIKQLKFRPAPENSRPQEERDFAPFSFLG